MHPDPRPLEMRIRGVVVDPKTKQPLVFLRGLAEPRMVLPIFVGPAEASAIAMVLAGVERRRPGTHDLMAGLLGELSVTLQRVTITDLIDGTYFAELTVADAQGHRWALDARPSDGLALAVRTGARVYASREVLSAAGTLAEEPTEATSGQGAPAEAAPGEVPSTPDGGRAGAATGQGPMASPGDEASPWPVDAEARLEDLHPGAFGKYKQ